MGRTQADELILVAQVYDHTARLRSYELAATLQDIIDIADERHPGVSLLLHSYGAWRAQCWIDVHFF